jgi:dihydroceramide fatty acyl 2-hydroxylase
MELRRTDFLSASPPMFESRTLDRLTRVHPIVPPLIFIPAIAVTFAMGQEGIAPLPVIAWLLGGYAIWSLTEYWMHRVIFHFEPEDGIGARLHWMIHGVHHDHPNDPMRLVMPPSVSVPLALGFFWLFHLVIGNQTANLVACGFLAGYLIYDMTHYYLHHRKATTRVGKFFYELHMRHHFQDDTRSFGVSVPFMDYVFRTQARRTKR